MLKAPRVRRRQVEAADAVANGDFRHFGPSRRAEAGREGLESGLACRPLAASEQHHPEVESMRAADLARLSVPGPARSGHLRHKASDSLRVSGPW